MFIGKIGLTGGSGVLGTILSARLTKLGHEVDQFKGDIVNQEEIESWLKKDFAAVFHFAAVVPVDIVEKDPSLAFKVNAEGTANLLKTIEKKGAKPWFFYASTSHVYKPSQMPLTEDAAQEPINIYGQTKLKGESYCHEFAKTSASAVCIGRIFSFFHENQKPPFLYPNLMQQISSLRPNGVLKLRGASNVRDLSNADEIVDKIIKLYGVRAKGVVNIASGKGISIGDFAKQNAPFPITVEPIEAGAQNSLVADISRFKKLTQ